MPKKKQVPPVQQTAIGDGNIQIVGDQNVVEQTFVQKVVNVFRGDTEAQRALRNRRSMLELVNNTWIKGVLEKSLYNEVLIQLGLEERPGAVEHPWDVQVQMPDKPNRELPAGTSMMEVFDELNGAMLILGEPGSGKTTMLLELARDCIARAQQDDNKPIPVVFNLSSRDGKQSIEEWLVNELRTKYNVPKKIALGWVENDDLHLLLDGLDEVKPENRETCVKAINEFRQVHGLASPIAVCSRIADYESLTAKLNLSGAVLLQPLTPKQIENYFEQAGPELEGARQMLKKDDVMREMAKQPLILSIMALVYQGKSPEIFDENAADTIEIRRGHLFDTYVQQMFERAARTKNELYNSGKTKRWLSWLAKKLIEYNVAPFLVGNMQPKWLDLKTKRFYRFFVGFIVGLSSGMMVGLYYSILFTLPINVPGITSGEKLIVIIGLTAGSGLTFALFGLLFELIPGVIHSTMLIQTVDALAWDFSKMIGGIRKTGLSTLLLGILFLGPIGGGLGKILGRLSDGLIIGLISGLLIGLLWTLTGGIRAGIVSKPIDEVTHPGQKLFLTAKNSLFAALFAILFLSMLVGFFVGLIAVFVFSAIGKPELGNSLMVGLRVGLFMWLISAPIFGMVSGSVYGGSVIIRHFLLRFLIARKDILPFRLIPFLDYCVDRIFLRRVGGGYIFVHRLLMERFAAMYQEENPTD